MFRRLLVIITGRHAIFFVSEILRRKKENFSKRTIHIFFLREFLEKNSSENILFLQIGEFLKENSNNKYLEVIRKERKDNNFISSK